MVVVHFLKSKSVKFERTTAAYFSLGMQQNTALPLSVKDDSPAWFMQGVDCKQRKTPYC